MSPNDFYLGMQVAQAYELGHLRGWKGPEFAEYAFNLLVSRPNHSFRSVSHLPVQNNGKMMLYQCTRKVLGKDTENYPQLIGDCFIAGTAVLMSDGSEKPIEDVKIGDIVINHLNQPRKVTNLIHKKFTGDLITIKAKGWHRTLTATSTHNGFYMPCNGYRFQLTEFATKPFGKYQASDYVLINYGQTQTRDDIETLDIAALVDDIDIEITKVQPKHSGKKINRYIDVDEKFARFIGLYLAEGGCDEVSGSIRFSYNTKETDLIKETQELFKDIFELDSTFHKVNSRGTCTVVTASSVIVAKFIKKLIPGNVYNKNIPSCFMTTYPNIKKALIKGWLDGDGHKHKKNNRLIGVSVSEKLIDDISRLALSIKINPRTLIRKSCLNRAKTLQCDFYGSSCNKLYSTAEYTPIKAIRDVILEKTPFGFARKLKSVKTTPVVNHDVYCVTVEGEHTLIVNGYAQNNCVSFGAKNAIEYLICVQRIIGNTFNLFRPIFPPYLYGCGRVFIGGERGSYQDGSVGSWQAEAVQKYGAVAADEQGVPKYSKQVAKEYGANGPPDTLVTIGKQYPVRSAALVRDWEDCVKSITNGYPCTVASNQGFTMKPDNNGFHKPEGEWGHQMCIIGVDNSYRTPYGIILNSWGDVFGQLKDFETGDDLPVGVIRAEADVIDRMIRNKDTFAYSHMEWFQEQKLPEDLFKLI